MSLLTLSLSDLFCLMHVQPQEDSSDSIPLAKLHLLPARLNMQMQMMQIGIRTDTTGPCPINKQYTKNINIQPPPPPPPPSNDMKQQKQQQEQLCICSVDSMYVKYVHKHHQLIICAARDVLCPVLSRPLVSVCLFISGCCLCSVVCCITISVFSSH